MKIKVGIVGYGNVGKAVESVVNKDKDFELVGIFSRRDTNVLSSPFDTRFFSQKTLLDGGFDKQIDVLMLCVGSAFDLEKIALNLAVRYATVDSFDNHARMQEYLGDLNTVCKMSETLALVGCGWDPGIFSLERALLESVMPKCALNTFWGSGVSQGHSEAIRRLDGVKYATQYTIPKLSAIEMARQGKSGFAVRDKHERECFVVLDPARYYGKAESEISAEDIQALEHKITQEIVTMPDYFAEYDTTVHFVSEQEYLAKHTKMRHAGQVIAVDKQGNDGLSQAEFRLKLGSNPYFTAQVMVACARANYRMKQAGETGAKTILDVPVKYLTKDGDGLRYI